MLALGSRNEIAATADVDKALEKLDSHMATKQKMMAATLSENLSVRHQTDGSIEPQYYTQSTLL
jgi:hypothetical protein